MWYHHVGQPTPFRKLLADFSCKVPVFADDITAKKYRTPLVGSQVSVVSVSVRFPLIHISGMNDESVSTTTNNDSGFIQSPELGRIRPSCFKGQKAASGTTFHLERNKNTLMATKK